MQSISVSLFQNHTRVSVVEIQRDEEQGGWGDGGCVGDALREFATTASEFEAGKDKYQVWISAYLGQATFMLPLEFCELIAEKGWIVVFDLND